MEIDINIRNATPEEAQRVLIGMSFAEDILGKLSPAVRIEKAQKKPVADPTCEKCSPPPAPDKTKAKGPMRPGPHNGNQYGIPPALYATDKRLYQRLWSRCKKHGIKYEAALEMEGKTKPGRASKQLTQAIAPSNEAKAPKKPRVKHERLPLKMKNKEPEGTVVIRYTGLDQDLAAALPEERPPTGPQEKREVEKTMDDIKIGDRVRQIGGMKICTGIGEIKRAVPGSPEVLVAFANGQEWISRRNLAPVMA